MERLRCLFENIFGVDYDEYEEETIISQEQKENEQAENEPLAQVNDKPENIIIGSLRKVIENIFDGSTEEPISAKEWIIAFSIIFSFILGGLFLKNYFEIKGPSSNVHGERHFAQDSMLTHISRNRHQSLKMLTDRFTNMHLDDAVTENYNKANEIMKDLDPTSDDFFIVSGKSYYSAGIVFASATYVPSFFSLFYDSTANASAQPNDSASSFQHLPIFKIWQERSEYLSSLKNHYQLFLESYEQKKKQDYIILCTQLKLDFIKALDFYTRVIIPHLNTDCLINKQLAAYRKCERTIADTSKYFGTRYFALTSFMEKLHFNALSTLYIHYAGESDRHFDPSVLFNSAEKMDSILTFDENTTSKDVFQQLQQSSAVILTFTDSTMAKLDNVLKDSKIDSGSK